MVTKIKKLVQLAALLCIILLSAVIASAAPCSGELFELKQPDESYVSVKVFGDEFYQRLESLEGYTLIRDPETNWICYADLNEDGTDLISTGIVYKSTSVSDKTKSPKVQLKVPKGLKISVDSVKSKVLKAKKDRNWEAFLMDAPTAAEEKVYNGQMYSKSSIEINSKSTQGITGNVVGLTLLINFPDKESDISKVEISNMMNQIGYSGYSNNGSVRDYFEYFSGGELVYTNVVTDYYTSRYDKSYYDNNENGKPGELIREALQNLKDNGFDFSALTVDSSNNVIALNVLYAGVADAGSPNGLWPHCSNIQPFTANGVTFSRYQIMSIGDDLSIDGIIHENGHSLCGWPDTYDYGYDSSGVNGFDVMCGGGTHKNPPPPNPYFANILAGWGEAVDLNNYADGSRVQVTQNSLNPFVFKHPEKDEYFMIQSIKKEGRYIDMPGEGLLIWHVDKEGDANYQNMAPSTHYKVSVEQADGLYELEKGLGSNAQDFFYAGYKDSFGPDTNPNSNWWNSNQPSIRLTDINATGTQFTFNRALPIDVTEQGSITVDNTSPQNEDKENAFDNNLNTKWLIFPSSGYIQYKFDNEAAYTVTGYSISSANDFPESDPSEWTLYGSNDNLSWESLDNRTAQVFTSRLQTKNYNIDNTNAYKYYRLGLSNSRENSIQLSEIQLFGYKYSSTPQITASADNSINEEGMEEAFDNNKNTKWLVFQNSGWITYNVGKPITVSSYSISSANDSPERDPESWRLWASKDNINWSLLDSQSNQSFGDRFQTKFYATDGNTDSFLYYKLELQSRSSILQLSEINFYEVTAGSENKPNEGKEKAFDGNSETKWLSFNSSNWITFRYLYPTAIASYAITSANDYPQRDPKTWTLMASNNNEDWDILDQRSDEIFESRFKKKNYSINNSTKYLYYKLNITKNNGDSFLQLSEIEYILAASTSTPSPTPTPTPTPSPTPTPTASGDLEVEFYNGDTSSSTNGISMKFKVSNKGSTAIDLSDVKIRYYYTIDGDIGQNFLCDWWTYNDPSKLTSNFVRLESPGTNADYYLEIGFASNAGTLQPGSSIEILSRISKSNWSSYNQTNDYSFNDSSHYTVWNNTPAYILGINAWGVEP